VSLSDPSVSIIVPSFNRCSRLERLLRRLDREPARNPPLEVVLAVDGSTDGTRDMLESLRVGYRLMVLVADNRGAAAARNRAIDAAHGQLVIFLDDDVEPADGLIQRHVEIHRRDSAAAVIGPMLPPSDMRLSPWLRWEAAMMQRQYAWFAAGGSPTPFHFYTGNASVRREHLLAIGGFDERFRRMEDMELAYRLAARGVRFTFEPQAIAMHEPDRTLAGWLRLAYQSGRHAVMLQRAAPAYVRELANQELRRRHLNRLPPRWSVGHPGRLRAVLAANGVLLRYRGPGQERLNRAACSVIYNVQFWQGFADELGTRTLAWTELNRQWRAALNAA
jgi:GT2 family glycosyltransferase